MAREKFSVKEIFGDEGKIIRSSDTTITGQSEGKKVRKGKKSFTIERNVIEDLEILAWYKDKSSSEVVEEALKKYIASNKAILEKAKWIREAR